MSDEIVDEADDYICVDLGDIRIVDGLGRELMQKDYRVGGEVWRVHKYDVDPFPSRPHAHCVGGRDRHIGLKLHLGTAALFKGNEPIGRKLHRDHFLRLCEIVSRKFPDIALPLPN
ncbi:hypothetical protein HAP47_0022350 [Bradyrhizobium sp. 41S5]|uniref:hypothetical protein n=1 Tax=Bradyrhizobium sp. 41S5 TaxID=1404443 RepID=UPI00156B6B07|nr:hypothetical protein [Bradyrhizobium sp. 41S5]UFX42023.1 hypothetical protein HAP47_0022350 [Bradyrhizobium sp. 41S5]